MTIRFSPCVSAAATLLAVFLAAIAPRLSARSHDAAAAQAARPAFTPNDGRLRDSDGRPRPDVLFTAPMLGGRCYLRNDGISYVFLEPVDLPAHEHSPAHSCAVRPIEREYRAWRVDVQFDGMNADAAARAEGAPLSYTAVATTAASVRRFAVTSSVRYENVYPNIDLVFRVGADGLKYDFIVRPGGNVSDIRMRYSGATSVSVGADGMLTAVTPLGSIREHAPVVFQEAAGVSAAGVSAAAARRSVPARYALRDNVLRFDVGAFDATLPLTIDPFVEWSTYCGGRNSEFATSTAIDGAGNILTAGWSNSDDFPATAGAWQRILSGKEDAFVAKFAPDGSPLWITYYGGTEKDLALGIAARANGDIAVCGYTLSTDFPVSVNAFQVAQAGIGDAFLLRFAPDGTLQWATFLGGSDEDEACSVAFDSQGDIVLTGRTFSANFPRSFGCLQFNRAGYFDAFIGKFRADGTRAWLTYYGGGLEEWGHSVSVDPQDNIVVAGHTYSTDFPVSANAFQKVYTGSGTEARMGFIMRLTPAGALVFASYLGGTAFSDAYGVAADRFGNLLVTGATDQGMPVSPGAYRTSRAGNLDGFIGKFTPDCRRVWLTLYGGAAIDVGYSIAAFPSGSVMVGGYTGSDDFPILPGAPQSTYGGGKFDAFVAKFHRDGSPTWSTYLGGARLELESDGRSLSGLATHWTGVASFSGWTSSSDFPITPGAFQTKSPTDSTWSGFLVKFGCVVAPPPAITAGGPNQFCEGGSVTLDAGPGYALYAWSTGDSTRTISVTKSGSYSVAVIDTNDCGGTSAAVDVTVFPLPAPLILADGPTTFCIGDSVRLDAGAGFVSYRWSNGDTTRYTIVKSSVSLTVAVRDGNGCEGSAPALAVTVNPRPAPVIAASGATTFCEGGFVDLDAGAGYKTYQWSGGQTSRTIRVTASGTHSVTVTNTFDCAATSAAVTVTVNPLPTPVIAITGDTVFCAGDSVLLDAGAGFASYAWSTGATTQRITVKATGLFSVAVTDANNCANASRPVRVTVNPKPTSVVTPLGRTSFCDGDSVVLDAGAGFASYLWSTGERTRSIIAKQSGNYSVTVTFATGCATGSASVPVTVFPNPAPQILAGGPLSFCDGDSVILSAPPGFSTYRWSTGATTQSITVKTSLLASVTVTDANGCTGASPSTQVTVFPLPPTPVITQRLDTLFSTPDIAYQWSAGGSDLPGETRQFLVIPRSGVYTVKVRNQFGCTAVSAPLSVTIARAMVALPVVEAAPGERVTIPLQLTSSDGLTLSGAKSFVAEIRFDKNLAYPTSAGNWSLQGDDRVLSLSGSWPDTVATLASFEVMAMLGNSSSMPLRITQFAWTSGAVFTTRSDGEFRLKICREGGDRLYDGGARFALAQNRPNPFNASTVIEYQLLERGPARLVVTDALGRTVAVLVDGEQDAGAYAARFDAPDLPSGVYHAQLLTAGSVLRRTMLLVK